MDLLCPGHQRFEVGLRLLDALLQLHQATGQSLDHRGRRPREENRHGSPGHSRAFRAPHHRRHTASRAPRQSPPPPLQALRQPAAGPEARSRRVRAEPGRLRDVDDLPALIPETILEKPKIYTPEVGELDRNHNRLMPSQPFVIVVRRSKRINTRLISCCNEQYLQSKSPFSAPKCLGYQRTCVPQQSC